MAEDPEVIASTVAWLTGRLKDGSPEDLEARRALAWSLRYGPLDRGRRFMLARLIDPDMREILSLYLAFKRPRGAKRTMDRRKVAAIIWKQFKAGTKKEAAVADAMEKCKVSRSKALEAYAEWEPLFESHGSKLKRLTRTD
jgi:hypothetical protein